MSGLKNSQYFDCNAAVYIYHGSSYGLVDTVTRNSTVTAYYNGGFLKASNVSGKYPLLFLYYLHSCLYRTGEKFTQASVFIVFFLSK